MKVILRDKPCDVVRTAFQNAGVAEKNCQDEFLLVRNPYENCTPIIKTTKNKLCKQQCADLKNPPFIDS